jgi:hypothetical protein
VRDGGFYAAGETTEDFMFELRPTKAFAFGKGERYSQTRCRF